MKPFVEDEDGLQLLTVVEKLSILDFCESSGYVSDQRSFIEWYLSSVLIAVCLSLIQSYLLKKELETINKIWDCGKKEKLQWKKEVEERKKQCLSTSNCRPSRRNIYEG